MTIRASCNWCLLAISAAMAIMGPASVQAQPEQFYKGKNVQVVVGFGAGGGYDAYARIVTRFMARHIPGTPTIVVQNMPGAGSRVAANWLYNVAPRDGAVLGSVVQSTPVDQVFGEPGIKFDASKFTWIGNPIVDNLVSIVTNQSGIERLEDVGPKGDLVCGSSGGGPTVTFPNTIGKLIGKQVKVVSGYPGVSAITLAMERGEVNCNGGQAWSSMKATMDRLIKDKKLNVLVQWGAEGDNDISRTMGRKIPLILDYARSDAERSALRLLSSTGALSRPILAPPAIPADRIGALRAAFDATMKDARFLEEAKKAGMDIKPKPGAESQALVEKIITTPPEEVELAKKLIR